ncbi:hypothetical protein [Brucella rhizosphaerae]|uniref:hypothetical protein n=1 Tax=Brucella rhizosphaerae TaxID=571254 RepID=UPI00126805FD|nr:hypothetical protein [Brucella rhizosphaerae]
MSQNVCVIPSEKFHYARNQWRIEVGGYTVLRLTYGATGGTLKTATASDDLGRPAYPHRPRLIHAMAISVEKHLNPAIDMVLREDSQRRQFLELSESGTLDEFFIAAKILAEEIFKLLPQPNYPILSNGRVRCLNGQLVEAA